MKDKENNLSASQRFDALVDSEIKSRVALNSMWDGGMGGMVWDGVAYEKVSQEKTALH